MSATFHHYCTPSLSMKVGFKGATFMFFTSVGLQLSRKVSLCTPRVPEWSHSRWVKVAIIGQNGLLKK